MPSPGLPGYDMPLNHQAIFAGGMKNCMLPNALDRASMLNGDVGRAKTLREITMMRAMNTITDKPGWEQKVFNDEIIAKWTNELLSSGQDISAKMVDWIIKELQWKTTAFHETGIVEAFDAGVFLSDTIIPEEQKVALQHAVSPLEKIQPRDYHPGSDMQVVDLVHPSLFPVTYGRTRILPEQTMGLDTCLTCIGQGELLPVRPEEEAACSFSNSFLSHRRYQTLGDSRPYSRKYQWLPCDVEIADDGCHIVSYINNLHPTDHRPLYSVIENILTRAIPLWDRTLTCSRNGAIRDRIKYTEVEYDESEEPEPTRADDEDEDLFGERYDEWEDSRPIQQPEPGDFEPPSPERWHKEINLRGKFSRLQVIVKLANIELRPEKPDYAGGSWHIEGQLNEHICATAIYYYDSENITESTLAFRQRLDIDAVRDVEYDQDQHEFVKQIFGFQGDTRGSDPNITQNLGSVVCREGRLLTFPNILQHRVSPFGLEDCTKPGHRKILALFLVDPNLRIISSANVPPQQEEWAADRRALVDDLLRRRLPAELQNMVKKELPEYTFTLEEAKEYRLELMEERSAKATEQNREFESGSFSLCEH